MRTGSIFKASVASTMSLIMAAVSASSSVAQESADADEELEEIVVTGIRSSLKQAMDIKRDARGVVDAISAEDMGKFPDTNLAESLQRITGVSIDRQNGEGSRVTVRGFGPEFNLVTLNGRQMPVSSLQDTSASSSRSFDFANIASEGVAGVQVYKTSRANIPTGGIGSTINIQTTRPLDSPGFKASVGAKAVMDTSTNDSTSVTPEISAIISNTFADDKVGVALSASYQDRKSGYNQANAGWRGSFLGEVNDWGTLPQVSDQITNRPGAGEVYATTQNMNYSMNEIDRERINGQLTLQFRPVESLTATVDFTYAENKIATERHDMSVWFNHGNTTSEWTDGPIAGPILYSENFAGGPSDMSFGAAQFAVKNENNSIGVNLEWAPTDNFTLELDLHDSSAESSSDSPYGSNVALGTAAFILNEQSIDFSQEFPVLSIDSTSGGQTVDPADIFATGNSFRNSYMRTDIRQAQINGSWDVDAGIVESIDFGASYTENKVRSAFANVQNDTWGGAGPASDLPDDIFEIVSVADKFDQLEGSDNPALVTDWVVYDFETIVGLIDDLYGVCGGNGQCASDDWSTDRRTTEESYAAYMQINTHWEMADRPMNLVAGLRYEKTEVVSSALVPSYSDTAWVAANEANVTGSGSDFTELTGEYEHWLPAIDFDMSPVDNVVMRASYSETIARPSYSDIQGGQTINTLFRVGGGTGNQGNPALLPFLSKNLDFTAEWYYDEASYIAVGYFHKDISNFIGNATVVDTPFSLPDPFQGDLYNDAVAALGSAADANAIRNWIFANAPANAVDITGVDAIGNTTGSIFGMPGDPLLQFTITTPVNNDRTEVLKGWEFALQHTFGETGFGAILNYTVVSGDIGFTDISNWTEEQFPLLGLSDSANIIGFYDKDGLQVRVAYNWRDKFLGGIIQGEYAQRYPAYTAAYGQFDVNVSYEVNDQITVFAEGINVTSATQRVHGPHENQALWVTQAGPRYNLGMRYKF
jgi:TonB-dependent receptor